MSLDLVIFGDDWGRHPSTTQHLARALPDARVVWVSSIGMRAPGANLKDLRRVWEKARARSSRADTDTEGHITLLAPRVVPFHNLALCRRLNLRILEGTLGARLASLGMTSPHVLAANPVAAFYLDAFPHQSVTYLRLDDYPRLPGVDPELARAAERAMCARATLRLATAKSLMAPHGDGELWHELPQGVDLEHFAKVPLTPPKSKVIGFFGLLAEWVDYDLIRAAAKAHPNYTFELRGPVASAPPDLTRQHNIRVLPPVPYEQLPLAASHWQGAWLPFRVNELTRGVNPLKIREYLAASWPTFSTPLPSVAELRSVRLGQRVEDFTRFLFEEVASDTQAARALRRTSVAQESWRARAEQWRRLLSRMPEHPESAPLKSEPGWPANC